MIFTIICALVLLDEAEAYTKTGLLWIFGTVALMIAGIQVMAWKTNKLADIDAESDEDDKDSGKTNSPVKLSQLLYDDKHDAHTKYLIKLFSSSTSNTTDHQNSPASTEME